MRLLFRAIAAGVLIGAALFFIPFLFGFVFFAIASFFIIRLVKGTRRYGRQWRAGYYERSYFANPYNDYSGNYTVPIDGSRFNSTIDREMPEQHFPVR